MQEEVDAIVFSTIASKIKLELPPSKGGCEKKKKGLFAQLMMRAPPRQRSRNKEKKTQAGTAGICRILSPLSRQYWYWYLCHHLRALSIALLDHHPLPIR